MAFDDPSVDISAGGRLRVTPGADEWPSGTIIHPDTPAAVAEALLRLRDELGMPIGNRMVQSQISVEALPSFGRKWRGWTVVLTGRVMDHLPDDPYGSPSWPWYSEDLAGGERIIQVWQIAVHPPTGNAYLARRWHPERGDTIALHGLERVAHPAEARAALLGLELLRKVDLARLPGRKVGTKNYTEAEFRVRYPAAYAKEAADLEKRGEQGLPTQYDVAARLGIGKRTLERYLNDDYHLPWPPSRS